MGNQTIPMVGIGRRYLHVTKMVAWSRHYWNFHPKETPRIRPHRNLRVDPERWRIRFGFDGSNTDLETASHTECSFCRNCFKVYQNEFWQLCTRYNQMIEEETYSNIWYWWSGATALVLPDRSVRIAWQIIPSLPWISSLVTLMPTIVRKKEKISSKKHAILIKNKKQTQQLIRLEFDTKHTISVNDFS